MLELLTQPQADPILSLIAKFKEDKRENKIDLGIGVYKDEYGQTPIMEAVRTAAVTISSTEKSKSYIGPMGDEVFNSLIQDLTLSGCKAASRASTIQTPGASGALRMLADLIYITKPNSKVWISNPSYINHRPIMEKAGLEVCEYPYFDLETKQVDENAMIDVVATLGKDDVLLVHGCCHNPTGADLSMQAWEKIAQLSQKNGFLPFIDVAYQGLGGDLDEDAKGYRFLVDQVEEALVSTSCSKNFGLYKERTGAAIVIGKTLKEAQVARTHMAQLSRGSYSMPPAHGASIVTEILSDDILTQQWKNELTHMRERIIDLRNGLVKSFAKQTNSNKFDYIALHKGMFSMTGFSDEEIQKLQEEHAIYIVKGGRINIAALQQNQIDEVVAAIIEVTS